MKILTDIESEVSSNGDFGKIELESFTQKSNFYFDFKALGRGERI